MSNPYIEPQNYYENYESTQSGQQDIALDELCWHVFNINEDGKKLLEIMKNRFLIMPTPGPVNENYPHMCVFYEGFREAFRQIIASVDGYQRKKDHEAKQAGIA
jgi:hypothetical protein